MSVTVKFSCSLIYAIQLLDRIFECSSQTINKKKKKSHQVFIELFDLPENAIVYIICSRCPKIACFNQDFMEDMRYEGKKRYSKLGISEII